MRLCTTVTAEGIVVSMAATSVWQQCANDDERRALSLDDGFSRSLQSCYTWERGRGQMEQWRAGEQMEQWGGEVAGHSYEVDLNLNQVLRLVP